MVKMAPGPDTNEMVTGLGYGLSSGFISPHLLAARAHRGANTFAHGMRRNRRIADRGTPLVSALALQGVSEKTSEATWAQPLTREELS
jgi:hypothetical protein